VLRRARIFGTFLLTFASLAGWGEWSWVFDGVLIHAQLHFTLAWAAVSIWALAQRARGNAAWALAFLIGHSWVYSSPFLHPTPRLEGPAGETLRVAWFNAWGKPTAVAAAHAYALEHELDLLALGQAGGVPAIRRLMADFPHYAYDHEDRIGLFSRVPIAQVRWHAGPAGHQPPVRKWLCARLENGADVWVGHVQTPAASAHLAGLAALQEALLLREAELGLAPSFLMADLNATPWSSDLGLLREQGWQSASAGTWPVRTWSDPSQPWLRWPIDYILVRQGVGVQHFEVGPALGSDHFLIHAVLQLPELP
jgi:endonuclease/exonuclease/phosphatase (EEP) superfamily protein YafD